MLRKVPSKTLTFFNAFLEEDSVDPTSSLMAGICFYWLAIQSALRSTRRDHSDTFPFEVIFLPISIAFLTFLTTRAILRTIDITIHANRKIALAFFKENAEHPGYKKENSVKIFCPILQCESEHPVCFSFTHQDRLYQHAYDYDALKEYFLTEHGTRCPVSRISLNNSSIADLTFSFDVPESVPEVIQAKAEEKTVTISNRMSYGSV